MKIAVVQPYLFPYIGYYQLIASCDKFVLFDDVNYIKRGFINRNNILVGGKVKMFSAPVLSVSQNKMILDHSYADDNRILKTIWHEYHKRPYFTEAYELIEKVFRSKNRSVVEINRLSIEIVMEYAGIPLSLYKSSDLAYDRGVSASDKLIDIVKGLGARSYVNPEGGRDLYSKEYFKLKEVELHFFKPEFEEYDQGTPSFVKNLSVIDILMNNDVEKIRSMFYKGAIV